MSSPNPSLINWVLFFSVIAFIVMGFWAFYVWWKKDRHTRERFAFSGFFALLGCVFFFLSSLLLNNSPLSGLVFILRKYFGLSNQPTPPPLTPMEAVLFLLSLGVLVFAYVEVFKHWKGQKSLAQHEQEQNNEAANVLRDIALLLSINREKREKLSPYQEDTEEHRTVLEKPESLTWYERARQLWLLRNRSYLFDAEYDPARKCWLGEEKYTGALQYGLEHFVLNNL